MTARSPIAPPTLRPLPRLASRLVPLLALGSACAMDLPISERIADVRPLAVRVEVLDPFAMPDAAVRTEALPIETILVRPLFVDEVEPFTPERIEAEIEPLWLACPLQPIQGIFACLSNHLPLTLDAIEECPPVDLGALDPGSGELPAMPAPCRITGGTPSEPTMQVPLDFNFFLGGDLAGLDRVQRLGNRADLVDLDQDGIRRLHVDALLEAYRIGDEEVVADDLHLLAERLGQLDVTFPVALVETVFDRDDRVLLAPVAVHLDHVVVAEQLVRVRLPELVTLAVAFVEELGGSAVERDADRHGLAVPDLKSGEPLQAMRRPVPEVERP